MTTFFHLNSHRAWQDRCWLPQFLLFHTLAFKGLGANRDQMRMGVDLNPGPIPPCTLNLSIPLSAPEPKHPNPKAPN